MNEVQFLTLLFSVAVLLWLVYGPWQSAMEAHFRERMFEARDNIFMFAAQGKLSFEDEGYRYLRFSLNKLIEFAHKVRMPTFVMICLLWKMGWAKRPQPVAHVLDHIHDGQVRRQVARELKRAQYAAAMLLLCRSPSIWPVFLVLWALKNFGIRTGFTLGRTGKIIAAESMVAEHG